MIPFLWLLQQLVGKKMEMAINFDVSNVRFQSCRDVENQLRQVPLLLHHDQYPYARATIAWTLLDPENIWPASLYVLSDHLATLRQLQRALNICGVDILNLDGGVSYRVNGVQHRILPPIVEESAADDFKLLILDGRHRIYRAREKGCLIRCIVLRGVNPEYPIPSFPNPNGWEDVRLLGTIPPHNQKKKYRSSGVVDGRMGMDTRRNLAILGIGGGIPRG